MAHTENILFEEKFIAGDRTYIIMVRRSVTGSRYLTVKEVPHTRVVNEDHPKIIVFEDHTTAFMSVLLRAAAFMDADALEAAWESYRVSTGAADTPPSEAPAGAYAPWTGEDDRRLRELHLSRVPITRIAEEFGRTPGAIRSRLKKLDEQEASPSA